jgi:predicted RNA-binding Zn-ribbon protein involved in translation (DUF1610 family)
MNFKELYKYFRNLPIILTAITGVFALFGGILLANIEPELIIIALLVGGLACFLTYYLVGIAISPLAICADYVLEKTETSEERDGGGETRQISESSNPTKISTHDSYVQKTCPNCGGIMRVKREQSQSKVKCPYCLEIFRAGEHE